MADEVGITISGIDEALAALDNVSAELQKEYIAKALVAASVPVFEAIKAETPVLTGDLAEHLQTKIELRPGGGSASVGFSGDIVHLANWIENGWKLTSHKPDKKFIKDIPPKPFMRIGAESSKEQAVEAMRDSLIESLGSK